MHNDLKIPHNFFKPHFFFYFLYPFKNRVRAYTRNRFYTVPMGLGSILALWKPGCGLYTDKYITAPIQGSAKGSLVFK